MQAADFFFAARLLKGGKADVTFKEADADKVSMLLGVSVNDLLNPVVARTGWERQSDTIKVCVQLKTMLLFMLLAQRIGSG